MKTADPFSLPRRRFVQGLALGATGLGLGLTPGQLLARQGHTGAPTLSGDTFHLTLGGADVNITGKTRPATTMALFSSQAEIPDRPWHPGLESSLHDGIHHLPLRPPSLIA